MSFSQQIVLQLNDEDFVNGRFNYEIPEGYNSQTYFITSLIIPWKFWYVRTGFNSRVSVGVNGVHVFTLTIPEGNYEYEELATAIQNELDSITPATWTASYDSIKDQFSFSNNSVSNWSFNFTNVNSDPSTHILLGFRNVTAVANNHNLFSTISPRLRDNIIKINVQSTVPSKFVYLGSHNNELQSFTIPLIVEFGDLIVFRNPSGELFHSSPQTIRNMSIAYYDENDNSIDLRGATSFIIIAPDNLENGGNENDYWE